MTSKEIREAFIKFWTEEPRNHAIAPNVSLVPKNDPTLLLVNSGMFPLVPYLLGEEHPQGKRLVNFQRSFRISDIEEIGDNRHTSMFEMMGNWSLGDYFKEKQIPWAMELYVERFKLDSKNLYVSVFAGDEDAPRDEEAIGLWKQEFKKYGIDAEVGPDTKNGDKDQGTGKEIKFGGNLRIFPYGKDANWWDRGTKVAGEPGGPDSEMFYDLGTKHNPKFGKYCHINCDCGRFIEVGNNVFMQYKLDENLKWQELSQKNIDFGGGFERVVMIAQGKIEAFESDLFQPVIKKLEEISGKDYKTKEKDNENTKAFRVIADHIRGVTFLLGDDVIPSNKEQGYILRRLIRRIVRYGKTLGITNLFTKDIAAIVIETMHNGYPNLKENEAQILNEIEKEEIKFAKTISHGLKELGKLVGKGEKIDGEKAFWLFETYGFPIEMTIEELKDTFSYEKTNAGVNDKGDFTKEDEKKLLEDFEKAKEAHQAMSRSGAEKKFKGGLADTSVQTTRLHTAHHLLLAALQEVLGHHVHQKGSNITAERLRIDFSHADKMTPEQIKLVEDIVNKKIEKGYKVEKKVMPKEEAERIGAEMEFGQKYGDLVNVYMIVDPETGEPYSKEFCGGPHVENTKELAESGTFKIVKEESSGSGVRRIKAVLEK